MRNKIKSITGDQDNTHTASNGVDIGRAVSDERDDMIYLGNMQLIYIPMTLLLMI